MPGGGRSRADADFRPSQSLQRAARKKLTACAPFFPPQGSEPPSVDAFMGESVDGVMLALAILALAGAAILAAIYAFDVLE